MPLLDAGPITPSSNIMGAVWMTMLLGGDAEARKAFEKALGGMMLDNALKVFPEKVDLTADDLAMIRAAPAGDLDLAPLMADALKAGYVTGEIVLIVLGLRQQAPKLATINSAVRIMERRLAKINASEPKEAAIPAGEASIKRAWRRMTCVAPFWAATILHQEYVEGLSGSYGQLFRFDGKVHDAGIQHGLQDFKALGAVVEADQEACLPFLATADAIRRDGEAFQLIRQKRPFLDPEIVYRWPEGLNLPTVKVPYQKLDQEELELASQL